MYFLLSLCGYQLEYNSVDEQIARLHVQLSTRMTSGCLVIKDTLLGWNEIVLESKI